MTNRANSTAEHAHAWTFFRQWLRNPIKTASLTPSGPQLTRMMMAELPANARRVIELGGGTGVFTRGLLNHGIAASDLMVLELSDALHLHLQKLFPGAHVVQGDARELSSLCVQSGYAEGGLADAVVSGLGMLSMPRQLQHDIIAAALSSMQVDGRFIQFTYGPANPIVQEVLDTLGLETRRGKTAWKNLPPATVYVYTRRR